MSPEPTPVKTEYAEKESDIKVSRFNITSRFYIGFISKGGRLSQVVQGEGGANAAPAMGRQATRRRL